MNPLLRFFVDMAIIYEYGRMRKEGCGSETVSRRMHRFERRFKNRIPWRYPFKRFLSWGLSQIEKQSR